MGQEDRYVFLIVADASDVLPLADFTSGRKGLRITNFGRKGTLSKKSAGRVADTISVMRTAMAPAPEATTTVVKVAHEVAAQLSNLPLSPALGPVEGAPGVGRTKGREYSYAHGLRDKGILGRDLIKEMFQAREIISRLDFQNEFERRGFKRSSAGPTMTVLFANGLMTRHRDATGAPVYRAAGPWAWPDQSAKAVAA